MYNIPSAKTVEQEGYELGKMTGLLLMKIEELTLYTIDQEKRIEQMQKQADENRDTQEKQQEIIDQQQQQLEQQKEIIGQQQKLIEEQQEYLQKISISPVWYILRVGICEFIFAAK